MIFFESHATSVDNEKGIASGWFNPSLSEKGIYQAKELGDRYQNEDLSVVYVSDLSRSYETAKIAFGHRAIPIIQDKRLKEWNYGKFNGYPALQVEGLKEHHLKLPFPEGESLEQAIERFDLFQKEYLRKTNEQKVMIIGHRATYYALEFYFHNTSLKNLVTAAWMWQPGWHYCLPQSMQTLLHENNL